VRQAAVTAELSTAFPDNGGYSLWVKGAFGDFWGVQQSYWSWVAGVVDNALYPVLLYSAAAHFFGSFAATPESIQPAHLARGCAHHVAAHTAHASFMSAPLMGLGDMGTRGGAGGMYLGAGSIYLASHLQLQQEEPQELLLQSHAPNASLLRHAFLDASPPATTPLMPPAAPPPAATTSTTVSGNLWLGALSGQPGCAVALGARLLILLLFTLPNLISSKLVGHGMTGLGAFVMAPFVVMSAWGLCSGAFRPSRLLALPPRGLSGIRWGPMLSVIFWSLEGFDSASTFAGEVDNPSRTYPRAMAISVVMMTLSYIVPLGVGAGVDGSEWPCWHDGSLSHVARLIGGKLLGGWVLLSAVVSNWGLFASELLEDSFQLLGMAQVGLAPSFFGRRSKAFQTPVNAILLQALIIAMLVGLDFDLIMAVDNFFSAAACTLEFAAAVQLRRSHPALARPYRVPLGTRALALLIAPPIAANAYPQAGRDDGRPRQRQRPAALPATATAQGAPPDPGQRPQPLRSHPPALQWPPRD